MAMLALFLMLAAPQRLAHGFAAVRPGGCRTLTRAFSSHRDIELISSAANPKVKLLHSLKTKRKRDSLGLVLVEGFRLIQDSLDCGFAVETLLMTESAANSPLGRQLRHTLYRTGKNSRLSYLSPEIYASVSDTVSGQGVVAAFEKPVHELPSLLALDPSQPAAHCSQAPLVVLFDGISDPGNAGTLIRSSYGLGAQAVVGVDSCDLWAPKVLRSAMSASLRMPVYEKKWTEAPSFLSDLIKTDFQVIVADAGGDARDYRMVDYKLPTVLVIGSEGHGVSANANLLPNKVKVCIPMIRPLDSFNSAVAGSILMAEAATQRARGSSR